MSGRPTPVPSRPRPPPFDFVNTKAKRQLAHAINILLLHTPETSEEDLRNNVLYRALLDIGAENIGDLMQLTPDEIDQLEAPIQASAAETIACPALQEFSRT